jgi:hypothetical protein
MKPASLRLAASASSPIKSACLVVQMCRLPVAVHPICRPGPTVRIRLPPAASPQKLGPSREIRLTPEHSGDSHEGRSGGRTDPPGCDPSAIGGALEWSRLDAAEPKPALRHDDTEGEGAAGQTLAIPAMTRVDQHRAFSTLIANHAALAPAGLRKLHRNPSAQVAFSEFDGPTTTTSIR